MDFDEFTRTGLRPLLQFARVLTGDRGLAEDVTQEVLIRQVHRVPDTVFGVGCAQAVLPAMAVARPGLVDGTGTGADADVHVSDARQRS